MAKQAIRHCVTLSANELVSKLVPVEDTKMQRSGIASQKNKVLKSRMGNVSAPSTPRKDSSLTSDLKINANASSVSSPQSDSDLSIDTSSTGDSPRSKFGAVSSDQIVMIDLRSDEDTEGNGGGTIAKAIRLDPACIKDTDMLSKWLQHFDGIKGCVICVIDIPPVQAPEVALWRRLLLGEGDGYAPGAIDYGGGSDLDSLDISQTPRDFQSPFAKLEEATMKEDSQRVGMKFALELQKNGFPYVSLLDGGFPGLVEALFNLRGTVEPVIIQHNVEAWQHFLRYSGRGQVILPMSGSGHLDLLSDDDSDDSSKKGTTKNPSSLFSKFMSQLQFPVKRLKDIDELERAKTAYGVAVELKHDKMASILKMKIDSMRGPDDENGGSIESDDGK